MKNLLLLFIALFLTHAGFAQNASGIEGKVIDEAGEDVINWPVKVYQGGREVMTVYTDDEGRYLAKPLVPNTYEVRVEMGKLIKSVQSLQLGMYSVLSINLDFSVTTITYDGPSYFIGNYCRPKPSSLKQSGNSVLTADQLEAMPVW